MTEFDAQFWSLVLERLSGAGTIIVIVLLTWLVLRLVNVARWRIEQRLERDEEPVDDRGRKARLRTLLVVGMHSARAVIISLGLFSLLSTLGVNITPLLTSVGAVGLALSLGAQTLIRDYIFGLILLVENQYAVGEMVTIGGATGVVERITMRATWLRDADGQLHAVPHGDVRTVTNRSRDWGLVSFEFSLKPERSVEQAQQTVQLLVQNVVRENRLEDDLFFVAPKVSAWESPAENCLKVRISTRTQVERRLAIEDLLRQKLQAQLTVSGLLA